MIPGEFIAIPNSEKYYHYACPNSGVYIHTGNDGGHVVASYEFNCEVATNGVPVNKRNVRKVYKILFGNVIKPSVTIPNDLLNFARRHPFWS